MIVISRGVYNCYCVAMRIFNWTSTPTETRRLEITNSK